MPSGLDLLRGEQSDRLITKQSEMDLLKQGQGQGRGQVTSGLDLLRQPQPELLAPVPKFEASTAPVSDLYEDPHIMNQMISAAPKPFYEKVGEMAFGEGITDSTLFQPPTMTDDDKRGAMEALNQLWGMAKNPYDAVRGTLTFAMSLPGFAQGALSAAVETSKEMGSRILKSEDFTLLDLYEAASKGMEKGAGRWHESIVAPFDRLLQSPMTFGKYLSKKAVGEGGEKEPTDYSAIIGEIGMAPYTAASTPIHTLAELDMFEYMPNVRGALHFIADVVGIVVMGRTYKGGHEQYAKDAKPILDKAEKIVIKQKEIDRIPDEVVKAAQQKVLDVEKVQAELEARKLNENIDTESVVKGDLKEKGKKVKEIKKEKAVKKKVTTGQDLIKEKKIEAKKKAKKKTKKEKIEGEEISYNVISTKDPKEFKIQAKIGEKIVGSADVSIYDNVAYTEGLHTLKEYQRKGIMTSIHNYILSSGLADKIDTFPDVFTEEGSMFFNKYREITDKSMLQGKTDYSKLDIERLKHILEEVKLTKDEKHELNRAGYPVKEINKMTVKEQWEKLERSRGIKPKGEELTTELDTQTGTPKPAELSTDQSPFRDKSVEETNTLHKLYKERIKNVLGDPDLFTGKLINDVNRWLNGEELPIEEIRNHLSELAIRADEVRDKFDKGEDFNVWKETVSDAAEWARNADRLDVKRTERLDLSTLDAVDNIIKDDSSNTLYSGVDPTQASKNIKKVIKSWSKNHDELLSNIINLMHKGKVDLDVNYSSGKIWKNLPNEIRPIIKMDKVPQTKDTIKADVSKHIPLDDQSINSIISDPPYLVVGKQIPTMAKRFGGFESLDALLAYHDGAMKEFARVLKPYGRVTIKIQDISKSTGERVSTMKGYDKARSYNIPVSDYIKRFATKYGMRYLGKFVYVNKGSLLVDLKGGEQRIPRIAHSEFLTFEKTKRPLKENVLLDKYGIGLDKADRLIPKRSEPTKLYDITGAAGEGAKQLIEGARKGFDYVRKSQGMKAFRPKEAAQMLRENFNRSFVDRSGNIRGKLLEALGDVGYDIIQRMYLSKGASSLSANMLKQMRKEAYSGMSKGDKIVFDTLALSVRMLDISKYKLPKEFAYPEGYTPAECAARMEIFKYKKVNGVRDYTDAEAYNLYHLKDDGSVGGKVGAYFDWMKKPLKDLLDAELISEQEYDALISHNYRRIKLVEIYDKQVPKLKKTDRTIYSSGVEALSKGKETDIYESSSEIMALEVFNRSYGRILNNRANLSLLEVAKADNTNPFVRIKEDPKDMIPTGWHRILVYEKGKRQELYISPEMSKEWITNNPEISYKMGQVLRYASASPVLRTFATGINWGFALANLPRDVLHTWFAAREFKDGKWTSVYSPHMPVFGLQIGRDLATILTDAALRKGRYEKYIEEGGGMEFLVHQGRLLQRGRHVEGSIDAIYNFLGYFGETSEIMTRLAIRDRVIRNRAKEQGLTFEEANKNPKITQEATFAARDYMDFGQGGGITKAADNAFPYLNAAVVGTRGLFRSFKPGSGTALSSTYKLAQFGALVAGLYIAKNKMHPKSSQALKGNIDEQNNLCLTLGDDFGFEDEHGQMRYPYIKIPIDPGQKFFKTFFEGSVDKWLGNEVDVNRIVDSLKEQSPVGVTELPPTISGTLGYVTNKDFWMNEDIWRKSDKPFSWPESKEEYIPGQTPQTFIDFGEATGMSPERTKYMIEELTTSGTLWSYLLGQGYDASFGDLPKNKKEQHLAMVLSKIPIIKRFFSVTNPYSQYGEKIDEAKEASDIQRWIQNRGLDMRVEGYLYQDNVSRKEVIDYMREFKDKDTYDRLKDRFTFQEKIKGLPNRTFWLRLKGLTTEARAKVYVDRLNSASDEERKELYEELGTVIKAGGVMSPGFREEVGKLRSGQ